MEEHYGDIISYQQKAYLFCHCCKVLMLNKCRIRATAIDKTQRTSEIRLKHVYYLYLTPTLVHCVPSPQPSYSLLTKTESNEAKGKVKPKPLSSQWWAGKMLTFAYLIKFWLGHNNKGLLYDWRTHRGGLFAYRPAVRV